MSQKASELFVCPIAVFLKGSAFPCCALQYSQPQDIQEATEKTCPKSAVHINRKKVLQMLATVTC